MFACVIIDQDAKALNKVFEYAIPDNLHVEKGMRVFVPFGSRIVQGFVVNTSDASNYDPNKLKKIISCIDDFCAIKPEMIELMNFMCRKYHLRQTSTLRLFLPSEMREGKVKELVEKICYLSDKVDIEQIKRAKKQVEIVEFLKENDKQKLSYIKENFSASAVKSLIEKNIVLIENKQVNRSPLSFERKDKQHILNDLQQYAVDNINGNQTYLLHGVTGSGKTEVYMQLIQKALLQGKNAIMLVPEISLTPQVLSNFKARFGEKIAILHSGLSAGERFDEWKRLFLGQANIAVGARSAIFAPLDNLGIVIIDEEHETSYVSESNPRYETHAVAEFRARFNKCSLVLGSATPSVESYQKTATGEYKLIELPVRVNKREMPKIQIVDMMMELRMGNTGVFSNQLIVDLMDCVNNKKQAMIFINRRGFSSFMQCKDCGYIAKCCTCDVSLVYHKQDNRLKCHYCGKQYKVLDICPNCKSERIKEGAIGTEKIVLELKKLFPDVKVLRMDNDTTSKKNAHAKILEEFKNAKPGILVGTQMIAKGHDFEDVVLVGIVDADQSLYQSDYRATERCFQLITQVSGRAGRSLEEGKVVLQTYSPKSYTYKFVANYDYKSFFKKELNLRQTANFPPFSKIVRILFSYHDENVLKEELKMCYNKLLKVREKYFDDIIYMDAMKSPVKRIQNKYRYQVVARIKTQNAEQIEDEMFECVNKDEKSSIFFETNPQNMS